MLTYVTKRSLPSFLANALKSVDFIHASSSVLARVDLAIVDICKEGHG